MDEKMNALVQAAMDAHDPMDPAYALSRQEALSVVHAVLTALREPTPLMVSAGEGQPDVAQAFAAMVDAVNDGVARAGLLRRAVVQGTGFEYLKCGIVVARIFQCIGDRAWSLTVDGKRWKLPPDYPANLIYRGGVTDTTYQPTLAEAEALLVDSLGQRRLILAWPQAA